MKFKKICLSVLVSCAFLCFYGCSAERQLNHITDVADLQGRTVGVSLVWSADYMLTDRSDLKLLRYNNISNLVMALKYGQVDAIAMERPFANEVMNCISGLRIVEQGTAEEVIVHPSKELTRRFMYRARMFEKKIANDDVDIYALCTEIRHFAIAFSLTARQSKAIDYLCEELLLPLLRTNKNKAHNAVLQVIAEESLTGYQVIMQFPAIEDNPLRAEDIDELGLKILDSYTKALDSSKNADGVWEIVAEI